MPIAMKYPHVGGPPAPSGATPPTSASVEPPTAIDTLTVGRLQPQFVDPGAWHELWSLVGDVPPTAKGPDEHQQLLQRTFGRQADGQLPPSFYLARELVWPLRDVYGVVQCVVAPKSDEQILELLEVSFPSTPRCASLESLIVGTWVGFATELDGALHGVPRVGLVMASAFDITTAITSHCGDDHDRLFRAYRPLLANNGIGNELRSINYVLTHANALYQLAARIDERGGDDGEYRLVGMHALPVEGTRQRPQMEVVASFQNTRGGAIGRWSLRVDVSGAFMFLVTDDIQPFYARPASLVQPHRPSDAALGPAEAGTTVVPPGHADGAAAAVPRGPEPVAAVDVHAHEAASSDGDAPPLRRPPHSTAAASATPEPNPSATPRADPAPNMADVSPPGATLTDRSTAPPNAAVGDPSRTAPSTPPTA